MTKEEFIESARLEGEEWRDVLGFEGLYIVSSFGRVAALKNSTHSAHLMNLTKMHRKKITYINLSLRKNNVRIHRLVHRMVAEAFIPNPNNYPNIDHIDCDGTNNRVTNLRWCTQSMNNHNVISIKRGSDAHKNKIMPFRKPIVQLLNGILVRKFDSLSEVDMCGFSHSCVVKVCQGKLSQHKGYQWMYLSDYENSISMSKNS
jgi:hypothetical protein